MHNRISAARKSPTAFEWDPLQQNNEWGYFWHIWSYLKASKDKWRKKRAQKLTGEGGCILARGRVRSRSLRGIERTPFPSPRDVYRNSALWPARQQLWYKCSGSICAGLWQCFPEWRVLYYGASPTQREVPSMGFLGGIWYSCSTLHSGESFHSGELRAWVLHDENSTDSREGCNETALCQQDMVRSM